MRGSGLTKALSLSLIHHPRLLTGWLTPRNEAIGSTEIRLQPIALHMFTPFHMSAHLQYLPWTLRDMALG